MKKNHNIATTLALVAKKNPEGFTWNLHSLCPQTTGYAVAVKETQNSFGVRGLVKVIEYSLHHHIPCIGGWRDSKTGRYYYDATMIVNTLDEAIRLGKVNQQIAIFDLNTNTEIRI